MTSISLVELLGLAESTFSIRVRSFDRFRPSRLRNNVTVHSFQTAQGDKQLGDAIFLAISDWLNDRGWTLSRWRMIKPLIKVESMSSSHLSKSSGSQPRIMQRAVRVLIQSGKTGYAAERANVATRTGLIRSVTATFVWSWVLRAMNRGANAEPPTGGASVWRKNRHNDADWSILEFDFGGVAGLTCYPDIWSESGVVIRTKVPIMTPFRVIMG